MALSLLQLELQDDCQNLYDKVDSALRTLEPTIDDLKKQVDVIVQDSYNFIDDVTDPLRATADAINTEVDKVSDLMYGIGKGQMSLAECYICINPASSNKLGSFGNKLANLGEDISDLGDDGVAFVYELTQLPTDLTTTGYKIATDFLNNLKTLPETAISTALAVLGAKYPAISKILDQIDCWIDCLANFCPDLSDRVDDLLFRAQEIRDDIKMSEDGSLDVYEVLEGSHLEFKKWANEVKTTVTDFQSRIEQISSGVAKTIKLRKEQEQTDENGVMVCKEDTVSNVRASDMADYGWPSGSDGSYQVTTDLASRFTVTLFGYLEDLGIEAKTALKQSSAVIDSLEELSEDGLKEKLKQDFLENAPPEPRGKGDISVEISVEDLFKTNKQTNEEINLDWYGVKSLMKVIINSGEQILTETIPAIVRSTDYSNYTESLEEQFDETIDAMIQRIKNMVPEDAEELGPFLEAVIKNMSLAVEEMAQKFKL